jgi:DNA repair protein SbcC/Rad50
MLPIRLKLQNFLPYRSPDPIYFEGIDLACLTGHNGAGKSSLLDAITWALWGKARARRDDALIHQGQMDMLVELDFEQEGTHYRVIRKRNRTGRRSTGTLDLFAIGTDELHTISEPNMRQTQAKIDRILRLDYETFVNSAFLQQGKADAFTVKTPAERKKILSDILGLEQWRVYEDRVKAYLKRIDTDLSNIDGSLKEINRELESEGQYQQELDLAEDRFDAAQATLDEAEQRLDDVRSAQTDLRNAQDQAAQIQRRINNLTSDRESLTTEIDRREQDVARYTAIIDRAEKIEAGYQSLQSAREADSSLGGKLREIRDLDKREQAIERQLAQARQALENERATHQATINEAQRLLERDISDDLAQVNAQISTLTQLERDRDARKQTLNALREEVSGLQAEQKSLKAEADKLKKRLEQLEQAEGATCPLCGQALDDAHRAEVIADVNDDLEHMRQVYAAATTRHHEISEEAGNIQTEIEAMGEQIAQLPRLQARAGAMQQQLDEANDARTRLQSAQTALQAIETALAENDYGHALWEQRADLQAEREAIGYDEARHDDIQAKLDQYRQFESEYTELQVARTKLDGEERALASLRERQQKTADALAEEHDSLEALQTTIAEHQERVQVFYQRTQEVAQRRTEVAQAREAVSAARQQLAALESRRQRKATLLVERQAKEEQRTIYQELALAFGKNGVPAMIIESAVPELETSANTFLTRMTDGRMNLRITTQRAKVSGEGAIETLDIEISDELGTRPYEMYSGGEAFRINFAIRIALSQMLARRAGAHLRTLFIDEGFGTQDDSGRNKLIEAIQAIRDDFEMILVITHIEDLRDAFPVHVTVEKTAQGSRVAVL